MKQLMVALYNNFKGGINWAHREFRESAENYMRDFRSLRAMWNWVYLALYVFLCIWGALYYANTALVTAIVTTGGLVATIFTVYVLSTHRERMSGIDSQKKPKPPTEHEHGESD